MIMKGITVSLLLGMVLPVCLGGVLSAALQEPEAPMTVEKAAANVFWVKGGAGANSGFVIGDKEVIVIDVKMTRDSGRCLLDVIARTTRFPVTTVILTHSDRDHVGGLAAFPTGLKIIAQKNCLAELAAAAAEEPYLKDHLPNVTFDGSMSFKSGGVLFELQYFGPAHTDGDAVVFLPGESLAFVGDLAFVSRDPLVHLEKHGSSLGVVRALQGILDFRPSIAGFIPGHDDLLARSDIEKVKNSVEGKRAKIKAMVASGVTLDGIKKALGGVEPPPGAMRFPSLAEVIYFELTGKKMP